MTTISQAYRQNLLAEINDRSAQIAIIGLGYVGLPLAIEFARAGLRVYGIDADETKCACLNGGHSYVGDVPNDTIAEQERLGRLAASSDFSVLDRCDAVIICVPTPLDKSKDPDISFIVAAAESLAEHIHPGMLVVLESTSYPGTTEEVLLPRITRNGCIVGQDLFLAYSPERIDPGNKIWNTHNTPKVIAGMTPACLEVATALYRLAVEKLVPVSNLAAAEMVKLLENTFRAVNIGLINEMYQICEALDIDIWEVIEAAKTKPYGYMPFYPGPGLGGHCIPIAPLYLTWKMRRLGMHTRFIELADSINTAMPHWWVRRVQDALNEAGKPLKGSHILVLGAAYKQDVNDLRESPALTIIRELAAHGADVSYNDPYIPSLQVDETGTFYSQELTAELLQTSDCVFIHTAHSIYDWTWIASQARLIIDSRNALARETPQVLPG